MSIGPELMSSRETEIFIHVCTISFKLVSSGRDSKGLECNENTKEFVSLVIDKDTLYARLTWPLGLYCIFL